MANVVPGQPAIINVQPPERFIRRVGNRFGMMDPAVQEQPAFLNNFAPPINFPN
uniref:Uncharacterized protein n=1 Tax=Panagrolaimus sp. JU765 TaxID=591449 RepID=A0AC34QDS5_9BILA